MEVVPGTESYWFDTYDEVARTGQAKRWEDYHQDTGRWYDVYASRVGQAGSRQVAVVFKDVTERKEREGWQAFPLQLSDEFRTNSDERAVGRTCVEALAVHMGVDRCSSPTCPVS